MSGSNVSSTKFGNTIVVPPNVQGAIDKAVADATKDAVKNPNIAIDNALSKFDGVDGKSIQTSNIIVDDNNNINIPGEITTGVGITSYTLPGAKGTPGQTLVDVGGDGIVSWQDPPGGNPFNQTLNTGDTVNFAFAGAGEISTPIISSLSGLEIDAPIVTLPNNSRLNWETKPQQYIQDFGILGSGELSVNVDKDLSILAPGATTLLTNNIEFTGVNDVEITSNNADILLNTGDGDIDLVSSGSSLIRTGDGPVAIESQQSSISLTTDLEVLVESTTSNAILNVERPTSPTNAEIKFSQKVPARDGMWRIGMLDQEDTFKLKDENNDTVFRAVNSITNNVIFDDYKIVGNDASITNVESSDVQVNGLNRFVRPDNTTAVGLQYENTAVGSDAWFLGSQVSTDSLVVNNGLGQKCLEVKQDNTVNVPNTLRLGDVANGYEFPTVKGTDNQYLALTGDALEFTSPPTTAYAELQILNNVEPFQSTLITVVGQWEEIVGPRVSGNSQGFASTNVLTYTGLDDKVFNVSASLSWECEGKVDDIEMAIAKNGLPISTTVQRGAVDDNNNFPRNVTTTCICPLSQNDVISIQVRNLTDTDNIQVIYGTLTASSVSATSISPVKNLQPHVTGFISGVITIPNTTPIELPFNNESSKFNIIHSIAPGSNTRFTIQEDGIYTAYAQIGTGQFFSTGYLGLYFEVVGNLARYGDLQMEFLGTLPFTFRPRMITHATFKILAGQQVRCMCRAFNNVPTDLGGNLNTAIVADYGICKISDLPP